ncbi:M23 family metallopeptidase [Alkalimonas sp. MEB108]|uniref:M23 family metallopeptidase n=1 Tax=Alkalimonas cellulosilytica TaxID=3058395 RepID=A0ABU7J2E2_9GAMM|nr:M23 family metallopeptidase [Alkalimonas sp. MEB108]MEE2000669.1 M23 family metallopeptidase [Alkalimonas sp. MEB108]
MKGWVKALLLSASLAGYTTTVAAGLSMDSIAVQGELTQGSLIRVTVPAGTKAWFNERELAVSPDGQLVFGIGRDAPLQHQLRLELEGQQLTVPLTFQAREYDIQRIEGVEQRFVSPPAEVQARIRRDSQLVRAARATETDLPYAFQQPVWPAYGRITGVYGSQRIFNGQPRNPHLGLDIAGPVGSPVYAPMTGVVTLAEDLYYSGLTLIIDHGYGVSTTLMHLDAFHVAVGDKVNQGQLVAAMGATGRVTGPHLDWRINWYQERLDPALLMPEAAPPLKK